MRPQKIVLLPPRDEYEPANVHVTESLLQSFLEHLASNGIDVLRSPEPLGPLGPKGEPLFEVEIDSNHPITELEAVFADFLDDQGLRKS